MFVVVNVTDKKISEGREELRRYHQSIKVDGDDILCRS